MKERVNQAVVTARPYVDRLARDEELHEHVKNAYATARTIYDDVIGSRSPQAMATRVATDKDLQGQLRSAVEELRKAGERAQGKESHTKRNAALLIVGITLGILFNPATGPQTRKWLKDKVLGPEQPFEYQTNEQ
jgi:gas vesicle protein